MKVMSMMSSGRVLVAATLCAMTASCGVGFKAATPKGFADISAMHEYSQYDYRATSADGVVISARRLPKETRNESGVTAEFWIKAIENRMKRRGGYALLGQKPVRSKDGTHGTRLRFGHDQHGKPFLYDINVFVTDDAVYLVEAGGKKDLVKKSQSKLDWATANFAITH